MTRYTVKHVEVEAMRWTQEQAMDVLAFVGKSGTMTKDFINDPGERMEEKWFLLISTVPDVKLGVISGMPVGVNTLRAEPGDWIVRHPNGAFTVVTHDVFHEHFEMAATDPDAPVDMSELGDLFGVRTPRMG